MTAEQIRAQKFECDDGLWECARWMQEIAAQLAEFNERERLALQPTYLREAPPARPAVMGGVQCGRCGAKLDAKGKCPICTNPPARPPDPTSGTDQARAILSPQAAAQSKPTASPIALRDRWARDRKGNELPNPEGSELIEVKLWKAERKDLADGTPRMKVAWNSPTARGSGDGNCFDDKLFPWLAAGTKTNETTALWITHNGKYTNIVGVRA